MPISRHGKVRHLLREGKARVVRREPFTIQLLYDSKEYTQPVTLGVDAGTGHVGLSATTEKTELFASEVTLRRDITSLLAARRVARPDMFTNRHLREAFGAVCSRWDSGEPVDVSVLMSVADSDAVRLLAAHTGSGGGIVETRNHARLLRQMWIARRAWNFGDRLMRTASEVSMMPEASSRR